jgi:hypothetical protein
MQTVKRLAQVAALAVGVALLVGCRGDSGQPKKPGKPIEAKPGEPPIPPPSKNPKDRT